MKSTQITATMLWLFVGFPCLFCLSGGFVRADDSLSDNFKNPDPRNPDREPVTWRPEFGASIFIENENLIIRDTDLGGAFPADFTGQDVLIESQLQVLKGSSAGVVLRWDRGGTGNCYFADVTATQARLFECGIIPIGDPVGVDFDLTQKDVVMQLQMVGDQLSFWAWPAEGSRPEDPLLTARDSRFTDGFVGVYVNGDGSDTSEAEFRYFNAVVIPEPSTAVLTALGLICFPAWLRKNRKLSHL